jgi:ATPase subunit of ABC transporter with duplicated ATPase domains
LASPGRAGGRAKENHVITVSNLFLTFGTRYLFKEVNLKFTEGNCYGIIGANGAGKSTLLKCISNEIDFYSGEINLEAGKRLSVLKQDQFAFDEFKVLHTVIMGNKHLYDVMVERDALYAKAEMTDAEGMRVADLEAEFGELGGYEAESDAAILLSGLGVEEKFHDRQMKDLETPQKVRVLLAQALFGNPDVLLLDEPTNNLDLESIKWLEDFLADFQNTVIVVSHDRHFLNQVCTHICDIDFGRIQTYVGNYDFWYHCSQLASKQRKDEKKKREEKIAELKEFIQRFSANASKSKQATSRRKVLDKLDIEDMPASSRKFPYCGFKAERECGKQVLAVRGLTKTVEGELQFKNWDFTVEAGQKIAFVGPMNMAKTAFFDIIGGESKPDAGGYEWGVTIKMGYFPKDNTKMFDSDLSITDWLRQYSPIQEEAYVRGFLGRMLFSGEEALKPVRVLSGGEKVRCMLSKLMLQAPNALVMDDPTNHLDLEAITALNDGLVEFDQVLLFESHDHQFISTIANRIVEFCPGGVIDKLMPFEEYLADESVKAQRDSYWHGHVAAQI